MTSKSIFKYGIFGDSIGTLDNWLEFVDFCIKECDNYKGQYAFGEWDIKFLKQIKKIQYMNNVNVSEKQYSQLFRIGLSKIGVIVTTQLLGPVTEKYWNNLNFTKKRKKIITSYYEKAGINQDMRNDSPF